MYSEAWPPDYNAVIQDRFERLRDILNDPDISWAVLKEHYSKFEAQSCIDFINHWCITTDPRAPKGMPKTMPFILFEKQEDFVHFIMDCLINKNPGLVEKCRDMGVTWLCVAISVWLWLFHPGMVIGWGSLLAHNIDDRGNPKSIFLKIRQTIENLPYFMLPIAEGFTRRECMPLMKILWPTGSENDAAIIGEGGVNVGRGGRTTIYFKDESAHYDQPQLIEASLGDNTDVPIDISSVNGTNLFYQKRQAGELWARDKLPEKGLTWVFIFDWRDHPGKTQEWYDLRRRRAEREGLLHIFMQEVERNYMASIDRIIIPYEWIEASVDAHKMLKLPTFGDKIAAQDIADEGGDKNALIIMHGIIVRFADHWGGDPGQAAQTSVPHCVDFGVSELYYDSIGVGAGFKVEINNMRAKTDERGKKIWPQRLRVFPWNAGAGVLDPEDNIIPGDMDSPTNEDQYANFKAQAWFRTRSRFYKTYRMVRFGEVYPVHELISLDSTMPLIHQLKAELAQAQSKKSEMNGKTVVDKKPKGSKSPNLADGVIMCSNPRREAGILDVL